MLYYEKKYRYMGFFGNLYIYKNYTKEPFVLLKDKIGKRPWNILTMSSSLAAYTLRY